MNVGTAAHQHMTVAHQSRPGRGSEVPRGAERLMGGPVLPTHAEGSCTSDQPAFTPTTGSEFPGSSFVTYLQRRRDRGLRLSRALTIPGTASPYPGGSVDIRSEMPRTSAGTWTTCPASWRKRILATSSPWRRSSQNLKTEASVLRRNVVRDRAGPVLEACRGRPGFVPCARSSCEQCRTESSERLRRCWSVPARRVPLFARRGG